jgi:hypothetical protein
MHIASSLLLSWIKSRMHHYHNTSRISPLFSHFPAACHYFGQVFRRMSLHRENNALMPSCLVFSSQWVARSPVLCTHLIIKLCEPARLEYEISRSIMREKPNLSFDGITLLLLFSFSQCHLMTCGGSCTVNLLN